MYLGQYSYLSAPVERFFAYLKSRELNPEGVPTGKKVSCFEYLNICSP